jgi:hypothetical protein
MAARTKAPRLIRYVSPFGSPAWMTREQAQVHLVADDARFVWLQESKPEYDVVNPKGAVDDAPSGQG